MHNFIGTKRVLAKPMTRGDYNLYRGWDLPANENGDDAGFLVEYVDGGQSNHPAHAGYISWSPASVFYKAYQAQPVIAEYSADDIATEEMIKARGLNARRVSLDELHASIASIEVVRHTTSSGSVLRFAILVMNNGFCVAGRPSVAVSAENDNDEVGVSVAIRNAVHELWPFVGFRVVEEKYNAKHAN